MKCTIKCLLVLLFANFILLSNDLSAQECKSEVIITTNSLSSVIFINDSLIGRGKTKVLLSKGNYDLLIKQDAFKWNPEIYTTTFVIDSCNGVIKIDHNFNKNEIKSFSESSNNVIVPTPSKSFLDSDLFKVLIGTAVVFGGTSAYYKLKADDNFDLYNSSGKQDYLDKTNKYDLISGIAFGALQINFGVLIYFFLKE